MLAKAAPVTRLNCFSGSAISRHTVGRYSCPAKLSNMPAMVLAKDELARGIGGSQGGRLEMLMADMPTKENKITTMMKVPSLEQSVSSHGRKAWATTIAMSVKVKITDP
mmetsp:Transcript_14936/g.32207  ORF Transcript_14936/g.32207 Transcript_14936/m.32207 type:complete len:109 (-) Transcript_14936:139-465(-)